MTISVIVPIHNAARTLPRLYERITAALAPIAGSHELILIDDGSLDDTWAVASEIAAVDRSVVLARMEQNVGQHRATLAAMLLANGDTIVTLDDDLEHPPESIPSLIAALHQSEAPGAAAIAQFGSTSRHPQWRVAASTALNPLFTVLLGKPLRLRLSAFRAMDRSVAEGLLALRIPKPVISPMLFRVTQNIVGVSVPAGDADLRSRYTLRGLMAIGLGSLYAAHPVALVASGATALGTGVGFITVGRVLLSGGEPPASAIVLAFMMFAIGTVGVAFAGQCGWVWGRLRIAARTLPQHTAAWSLSRPECDSPGYDETPSDV